MDEGMEAYGEAAEEIVDYSQEHSFQLQFTKEEVDSLSEAFKQRFSPEVLQSLPDTTLLKYIFLTSDGTKDSLCYHLEFDQQIKTAFGSISGGSSFKYGLFQRQSDGQWVTGSSRNPEILSDADALVLGKKIRDALVQAAEIVQRTSLATKSDYEKLDDDLNLSVGRISSNAWVRKYLYVLFPDKFVGWYSPEWLRHILFGLGIEPSNKYYGMSGQLALVKLQTKLSSPDFQEMCQSMFNGIRHFFLLESSVENDNYADEWKKSGIVAMGWSKTGDLLEYNSGNSLDKKKLSKSLENTYFNGNSKMAAQIASELKAFYEADTSAVIAIMKEHRLIALVDHITPYFFEKESDYAHQKRGKWHLLVAEDAALPDEEDGYEVFGEIKKSKNLLYLYRIYFHSKKSPLVKNTAPFSANISVKEDKLLPGESYGNVDSLQKILYKTKISPSRFSLNRIIFGAPGTGKSFCLNEDKDELLKNGGTYERVTFHPDYTYAQFVGTYKPVTDENGDIKYEFVQGPFMRMYVKALKDGNSEHPVPHLLLIEEINRARVAAVFGDVFQLLDRDNDGVSQYGIQASEDVKKYLVRELHCDKSVCSEIKLPNNMFIWATMNSADQGVFPMDTAFKRRWDFEYLGVDDNEDKVNCSVELVNDRPDTKVNWNAFRKAINKKLTEECHLNEDKLLGPFFLSGQVLAADDNGNVVDAKKFREAFKNKVIMYLFEDAARQYRQKFFKAEISDRYSHICTAFDTSGMAIFGDDFKDYYDHFAPQENS